MRLPALQRNFFRLPSQKFDLVEKSRPIPLTYALAPAVVLLGASRTPNLSHSTTPPLIATKEKT